MIISKTMTAEIGHRLLKHKGKCSRLHGHSYQFTIYVSGNRKPSTGMVLDYHYLKVKLKKIIDTWDHRTILQRKDPLIKHLKRDEVIVWKEHPTAEVIAWKLFTALNYHINKLERVIVRETATTTAEISKKD